MGVDNSNVGRRYLSEVWSKGNVAAIEELVDDNIVVKDTMGTDIKGKDKVKEMVKMMKGTFSDNTFTIEEIIVAGDRVVIRHEWKGTHTGPFMGLPATGKTIANKGVEVLRIANGKVVENFGYMDLYSMFRKLGALPDADKLVKEKPAAPITASLG